MPTLVENSNHTLRQALSQITQTPDDQIAQVEALRRIYLHSITLVSWSSALSFNCVQYAFDLIDLSDAIRHKIDRLNNQGIFPRINPLDTPFVNFLIKGGDLRELAPAENGGVIVYLDGNNMVRHCGKIFGECVRSKWGHLGHLWEHRIEEVPITYGTPKRFTSIAPDESIPRLLSFMEEIRDADTSRKRMCLLACLSAAEYSRGV